MTILAVRTRKFAIIKYLHFLKMKSSATSFWVKKEAEGGGVGLVGGVPGVITSRHIYTLKNVRKIMNIHHIMK